MHDTKRFLMGNQAVRAFKVGDYIDMPLWAWHAELAGHITRTNFHNWSHNTNKPTWRGGFHVLVHYGCTEFWGLGRDDPHVTTGGWSWPANDAYEDAKYGDWVVQEEEGGKIYRMGHDDFAAKADLIEVVPNPWLVRKVRTGPQSYKDPEYAKILAALNSQQGLEAGHSPAADTPQLDEQHAAPASLILHPSSPPLGLA